MDKVSTIRDESNFIMSRPFSRRYIRYDERQCELHLTIAIRTSEAWSSDTGIGSSLRVSWPRR